MGDAFLGEVRAMPYDYVPQGWAPCSGQLLQPASNTALFSLIGFTYGGDGKTTFAVPDLRGRVVLHQAQGLPPTARLGAETVTLTANQLATHTHRVDVSGQMASDTSPVDALLAASSRSYAALETRSTPLHSSTVSTTGSGAPHENRQPYLALCWMMAIHGLFPSRP